jgi:hypothetical protein
VEDLKIEEKERVPANTTNALGSKVDPSQVEAVVLNVSKSFSFAPSEVMEEPKETKRNQVSAEPVDHEKYTTKNPHSESRKDKGTTRSGRVIAGSGKLKGRKRRGSGRRESSSPEKGREDRSSKYKPSLGKRQFREDSEERQEGEGKASEPMGVMDQSAEVPRKVVKKIAKELTKRYQTDKIRAQTIAMKIERKIIVQIERERPQELNEEAYVARYKSLAVELIKTIQVSLLLSRTEDSTWMLCSPSRICSLMLPRNSCRMALLTIN